MLKHPKEAALLLSCLSAQASDDITESVEYILHSNEKADFIERRKEQVEGGFYEKRR